MKRKTRKSCCPNCVPKKKLKAFITKEVRRILHYQSRFILGIHYDFVAEYTRGVLRRLTKIGGAE